MDINETRSLVAEYVNEGSGIESEELLYRMYIINSFDDEANRHILEGLCAGHHIAKFVFVLDKGVKTYYFPKGTRLREAEP